MQKRFGEIAGLAICGFAVLAGCADSAGGAVGDGRFGPITGEPQPDTPARVANFIGFDQPPEPGETILAGTTGFVRLNADTVAAATGTAGSGGPGPGWLIWTDFNSPDEELAIEAAGGNALFVGDGFTRSAGDDVIRYDDGGGIQAQIGDTEELGFIYQTFGAWTVDQPGGAVAGVGSFGAPAPDGFTPVFASASYEGTAQGLVVANGHMSSVVADAQVSTDFNTVEFETTSTVIESGMTGLTASDLDLTGTATVSGSGFSGTAGGAVTSGTLSGTFYGPQGDEVGGVFSTQGGGATYIGAFGGVLD